MLNKREAQIIQALAREKGNFLTSQNLAEKLACSDRTVRTYYKSLVEKLKDYPELSLTAKKGYGYRLDIYDDSAYVAFLEDNHLTDLILNYKNVATAEERYNYLLNKLLVEQEPVLFDDLADELYVSRSTLSNDFKKIRQSLAPYNLRIESRVNKGVFVTGDERHKRRFIINHFITSGFASTMHSYVGTHLLNELISFEKLTIIVLDECREERLSLPDFVIQNLVVHIALALRRTIEGFHISKLRDSSAIINVHERIIAKRILNRVSEATGITFPDEEIDYVTLHLVSKGHRKKFYLSEDQKEILYRELMFALNDLKPSIERDFQFYEGVVDHLLTLLIRLKNHVILENPLLSDIRNHYPKMFQLVKETLALMPSFTDFELSDDEIAYVALHFVAARERYKKYDKYNILVICATGYGSAQLLKSRLVNEFGQMIHIVDVIGYYEISDEKLKGIDFIVSSIDLSNLIFNIPIFTVSVFLDDEEINRIKEGIDKLTKNSVGVLDSVRKPIEGEKYFDDYFSEEAFLVINEPVDKESLLKRLITSLSNYEGEDFEELMLQLIEQREEMSSFLFSDTIAVPHPIKALANQHRIAVAIVPEGMFWNDEAPNIKFIFLSSMSIYDNEGLPELASMIVDLVDRPLLQEQLLTCQTFAEFRQLFLSI